MPYVMRTVIAGGVKETKKMFTGRVHTKGAPREKNHRKTTESQHAVNERKAEDNLRWILNANYDENDIHAVLHYYDKKIELEKAEEDKHKFCRLLRSYCQKNGIRWKCVAGTESRYNPHHHLVIPDISLKELRKIWWKVVGENQGNVSLKPLDRRRNHKKLARYLMKETRKTVKRYRETGKRYKRFSTSKGLIRPEPKYQIVSASSWAKEPRKHKGWSFWQDDDGTIIRQGVHEITGYVWQEYTEVWLGPDPPPGQKIRRRMIA